MDQSARAYFEEIFERCSTAMYRYIALKVADRSMVEDISSQTFLKFWDRVRGGEQIENPRALLYTIAHGLVVDHYRKAARQKTVSIDLFDDVFEGETEGDITATVNDRLSFAAVMNSLATLKDEYQEILLLHYVQDISVSEIAGILEQSENVIRVRIHRALSKLRAVMEHAHTV